MYNLYTCIHTYIHTYIHIHSPEAVFELFRLYIMPVVFFEQ